MKKKKLKGLSDYYSNNIGMGELALREAFFRATKETLENFGITQYSVEKISGMTLLLEQWAIIEDEQS